MRTNAVPNRNCCSDPVERHSAIQFVSTIVKAAITRFRSTCAVRRRDASTKPASESSSANELNQLLAKKPPTLNKPTTPNFTKKPLKKTENSVEASTWAFRSQDENGHMGTFTIKPAEASTKPTTVKGSVAESAGENAVNTRERTKHRLPNIAQTYISNNASALRSYLLWIFKRERAPAAINSKQKMTEKSESAHKRPRPEHKIISKRLHSSGEFWRVDEAVNVSKKPDDQAAAKTNGL